MYIRTGQLEFLTILQHCLLLLRIDFEKEKMSASKDYKEDKNSCKDGDEKWDNDEKENDLPLINVEIVSLDINPLGKSDISAPLELNIRFELDRDVVAAYWIVKFLVDSCDKRIIRVSVKVNYY